ncbi:hypothetical protein RRG08_043531 [Elysia crispata]|uniref:Uncharacterized protein n=1 Tax=Elysia crispata TaxID=231223 RepID=A0AAE0YFK1_9GAST|nr:hypothetical protein RRG08_043531 [Elysia crispata]
MRNNRRQGHFSMEAVCICRLRYDNLLDQVTLRPPSACLVVLDDSADLRLAYPSPSSVDQMIMYPRRPLPSLHGGAESEGRALGKGRQRGLNSLDRRRVLILHQKTGGKNGLDLKSSNSIVFCGLRHWQAQQRTRKAEPWCGACVDACDGRPGLGVVYVTRA